MRWIMNAETGPAAAVPATVPLKMLSNETNSERKITCLKRTLNSELIPQTRAKRKCSTWREFPEMCLPIACSLTNTVQHPEFSNELQVGNASSCSFIEKLHNPHQFQSSEDLRRKEKYALQIQRTMIADEDGDRPIHISVVQEDANLVQRLCKLMKAIGAPLDIFNNLRQTPLHLAVIIRNPYIIKILLQHGASVYVKDRRGSNAIQLAVKFFQEECFQVLLGDPSSRSALDALDYEGLSAVQHAVINGNMSAVNLLYHCGADVNNIDGKSGRTALMQAVLQGNVEMVHLLLKCGAFVSKADYSGLSALDIAHQMSNKEIIQLLEKEMATKQESEKEDASDVFRTHTTCNSSNISQLAQKKRSKK